MQNCIKIGKHKHGCCVMQRCLEKGTRSQKLALANHIIEHIHHLIEDPYGNYLVQNVLKLEDEHRNGLIIKQIATDFIRLSQLKFSSNVIEVCLDSRHTGGKNSASSHIDKIFKGTFEDDDLQIIRELGFNTAHSKNLKARVHFIVQKLVYNQFGNYVLQRALNVISDDELRKEILYTIKSLQPSLMQLKHGQKVLQKLQKTYPQIFLAAPCAGAAQGGYEACAQYAQGPAFSPAASQASQPNFSSAGGHAMKYQQKAGPVMAGKQGGLKIAPNQSFKPTYHQSQQKPAAAAQPFQQNFSI